MNKPIDIRKILLRVAAVLVTAVVLAGLIVGDYYIWKYEGEVMNFLSPSTNVYDTSQMEEINAASQDVSEEIGEEGIVLLKNEGDALPLNLKKDTEKRINLLGVGSTDLDKNGFASWGAGSGSITVYKENVVWPVQALTEAGFTVNESLHDYFTEKGENPATDWWDSSSAQSKYLNYAKAWSDVAVIFITRYTGENVNDASHAYDGLAAGYNWPWRYDWRDTETDGRNFLQISEREEKMIDWCSQNFKKTVVVLNSGNTMEPGILASDKVDAVLYCPFPGQYAARAIGTILSGETNPSGHMTDTMVFDTSKDPTRANAFVNESKGKQIAYAEDIYVGYKWYETADHDGYFTNTGTSYDKVVWRPFGYGQTYTSFEWEVEQVSKKEGDAADAALAAGGTLTDKDTAISVRVKVTNTGSVAGREVVQLYVNPPYTTGGIEKPYVALAAFGKTDLLAAGESQVLTLTFDLYGISSYDCYDRNKNGKSVWELDEGTYHILLRSDAHTTADCENADFRFTLPAGGFQWTTDPVSGGEIANRFTGSTAEAGTPIDGSREGNTPIVYLSRANFEGTFPTTQVAPRNVGYDIAIEGTAYINDAEYFPEATMPTFDSKDTSHMLYTLEDGSRPSLEDLKRTSGKKLVANDELMMKIGSDYDAPEWDQILDQMSKYDMKDLICRNGSYCPEVASIAKMQWLGSDGPQGINWFSVTSAQDTWCTGFPASVMCAQTWNADLNRQKGVAMGQEYVAKGLQYGYSCAIDLHRHAYNGRNFEQLSEDPYLSGTIGAKVAYGMLTQGVSCVVKHFALSQPGKNARDYNTWLTEQNLRENYIKPFEICVKESRINFMMTSFANVGGVRCAYSYALDTQVLRDEWGFRGSLLTDAQVQSSSRTSASLIRAGNDIRFGYDAGNRNDLSDDNTVDMYLARKATHNILYAICNSYYRAKSYDPNYTITDLTIIPGVNWWLPTLIVLEVLVVGALGYFLYVAFRTKKRKKSTVAVAEGAPEGAEEQTEIAESVLPPAEAEPVESEPPAEPAPVAVAAEPAEAEPAPEPPAEPVPVPVAVAVAAEPAEAEPAPEPAPAPAVSEEIGKMRGEIDSLREEIAKLTAAMAAQQEAIEKQQRAPREKKSSKAERELAALREENASLKEELLNGQIEQLNRQVAEQQAKLDKQSRQARDPNKPKKPSKTQRELSELREEVAELKETLKKDDGE